MKNIFCVNKRTLLLIAGIVWLLAGFNVARLGILSYRAIDPKWYLYLLSVCVFCMFGSMFRKMSKKAHETDYRLRNPSSVLAFL